MKMMDVPGYSVEPCDDEVIRINAVKQVRWVQRYKVVDKEGHIIRFPLFHRHREAKKWIREKMQERQGK